MADTHPGNRSASGEGGVQNPLAASAKTIKEETPVSSSLLKPQSTIVVSQRFRSLNNFSSYSARE